MKSNLRIPQKKRHSFSAPLGTLIAGTREETLLEVENLFKGDIESKLKLNFYIVGDIVAQDFLSNQILKQYIKICVIDEKTQRNYIGLDFEDYFEQTIEFKNAEGTINKDCWNIFREVIKSEKKTLIKITEGEEDLLILPLVLEVPLTEGVKNFAFYGQPPITDSKFAIPEGIVVVNINTKIQKRVQTAISLMEKF